MHIPLLSYRQTHILESVRASLKTLSYPQLRQIECTSDTSDDRAVVLHGIVNSFYLKQLAQTVVLKVDGVSRVVNNVQVVDDIALG